VFCQAARWVEATPEQRAVLVARAVVLARRGGTPCVVSHASAAAVYGLPVPRRLAETCWITVATGHGARTHYDGVLRQEVATLRPNDVCVVGGLVVTSLARTVADCLRHLPPEDAVAVADAAVRRGLAPELVARTLREQESWPLAAAARAALPLVDGRRESALESRSAVVMHRFGIPQPLSQVEIRNRQGVLVGRVDVFWPRHGEVGEADGRGKYQGDDGLRAFEGEKDRQAELEGLGLVVVRWGSRHLVGNPPSAVMRIRSALERPPRGPLTGSFRQVPPPRYSL
jgi:hypothetical protein